jgi:hypothetical protein
MPYWPVSIIQYASVLVGNKARCCPKIARIDGERIKGGMLDGCDAWIGLVVRIAQISLIRIPAAAEIAIETIAGLIIKPAHAGFEVIWIYSQCRCERRHSLPPRQVSALAVLAQRHRERLDRTKGIFSQKTPVADQISWNRRACVMRLERRPPERVAGNSLIGKPQAASI